MEYYDFFKYRTQEYSMKLFEARMRDAEEIYEKFHKDFEERNCPFCGQKQEISKDKFLNLYNVCLCKGCNSEYVNPVPNLKALEYYYNHCENNRIYASLNKKQKKSAKVDERALFVYEYLEELLKNKKEINVLEIGCNSGVFLENLYDKLKRENVKNVNLYGVDLDKEALESATSVGGGDIVLKNLGAENISLLGVKFDVIVHFELIEHLIDPSSFIRSIYENLNQEGLCIFTTPNALGLDNLAIHYNKIRFMAGGIYPPMHINAFSTQNVLLFAYRNNFKLKSVKTPGKFDMSLLSIHADELDNEILKEIAQMDNQTKAYMQYLISYINGSTHMRVVLEK